MVAIRHTSAESTCPTVFGMDTPSDGVRGERRWPMATTLIVAMALPFLLPLTYALGPRWIIPAIEAVFLLALILADPGRIDRRSTVVRTLSLGLVAILAAGAAGATVRLVVDLVRGGVETNSPGGLLRIGGVVWIYVVITFSFLYWELDGGGPEVRARSTPEYPDLALPEHLNPHLQLVPDGVPSSSTICTSVSRIRRHSAPPMSCRSPVGRNSPWRSRRPPHSSSWDW